LEVLLLGKKIFTAVLAFALAIMTLFGGEGKYASRFGASFGEAAPSEEAAVGFSPLHDIPAPTGDDVTVAGITDTRSLRKIMPYFLLLGEAVSRDIALADSRVDIARGLSLIGNADVFLDAADSVAVCSTPGPGGKFYASLSVDGKKFDKLTADGGVMKLEKWDGANVPSGVDAWAVKPSAPEIANKTFYMTRRNAEGRDAVNIASGAKEIGEMTESARNPKKRLSVTRLTDGENFVAMNFANRLKIMNGLSIGRAETSWSLKDKLLEIRSHSDMYGFIASRLAGRTFSPGAAPTLGDGAVAFFAAVDPAFCLSVLFPAAPDPVKEAIGQWGVPQEFAAGIEAVLQNCRISAVAVAKGETLDTAYLVIETEARGSLAMLYMIAAAMSAEMEDVSAVQLAGWDSAFEMRLDPHIKMIAAWHEGMVLLGIGEAASFGKQADVSAVAVPAPDASRVSAFTAASRILEVKVPGRDETVRDMITRYLNSLNMPEALRDMAWLDKIDRLDFADFLGGGCEINITFKE
jgi:hypothetical protein